MVERSAGSHFALRIGRGQQGDRVIPVDLTKTQIEKSPSLASDRPVSRQYQWDYHSYYGWPGGWGGPYTWEGDAYPTPRPDEWSEGSRGTEGEDPHLRSTKDVTGRNIQAQDGEIGHIEDFVIDDEAWAIRYLIVDTQNWWPGEKVLISTRWIERISWGESKVFVNLTREAIRQAPEYIEGTPITRDHETKLHRHYNREGYWASEPAAKSAVNLR